MAVIPQEPLIIEGTLRKNVDLKAEFDDLYIIEVLKKSFIWNSNMFDEVDIEKDSVQMSENDAKLNFLINENGDNLSIG